MINVHSLLSIIHKHIILIEPSFSNSNGLESRIGIQGCIKRCGFLYPRGRWSRWRGQPWWGACGVVAGWGFGHGKPFSKSGLVWRTRSGNESEWAPRLVQLFLVFLPLAVARFLADSLHRFPLVRRSLRRRARRGLAN